jgi:hypothetical protein
MVDWSTLTVSELKSALAEKGLPTKGTKKQLVLRMDAWFKAEKVPRSKPLVVPGTAGIEGVATAEVRSMPPILR